MVDHHELPPDYPRTITETVVWQGRAEIGKIDKTLFIRRHKGDILLVQVYVDDIIFGSTKKEMCIDFEKLKYDNFQTSYIGELTFFLRLQVKKKKDGIFISQDKYVAKIFEKFRFTEVKTASTQIKTQKPLLKDEDDEEVNVYMYRSMIGSMMYLTSLMPDIMFTVCAYARFQVNPMVAYTVSDYAGASLDKKSTTRGCQFFGCRLISWQCKKQIVIRNSISEAEYVAASSSYGQVLWFQNQLLNYGFEKRVKKLKKKNKSRTHKLKRLYKVGLTVSVVESSNDNDENFGEDASKQGRIDDIDADEDITLVSINDEVIKLVKEVMEVTNTAKLIAEVKEVTTLITPVSASPITTVEATKTVKITQSPKKRKNFFVAKRVKEKRNKPPTKDQQRKIMCTYLKNIKDYKLNDLKHFDFDTIQEKFDNALKRVNMFVDKDAELMDKGKEKRGDELMQEQAKKQKNIFEPHIEDTIWRTEDGFKVLEWKLYDNYRVHTLRMQSMQVYMLVEKIYPLTPSTLTMMLNKKLHADHLLEMFISCSN
nr:putative ribonuclease H-like domain-containing protein [Tanacetum cinerariifolium]